MRCACVFQRFSEFSHFVIFPKEGLSMKLIRTGLMLGSAAALLPAMALAQTTAPTAGAPAASTSPQTTAPASTGATAATTGAQSTAPSSGAPTTLAAGAKVLDTTGGTVGTIESVDGDFAVIATSKSKVRLPKTSFAMGPNGPVIAMTATQLDAAVAQAAPAQTAAASKPNVVQGAAVSDMQGASVGTIADVDAQFATVQLSSGGKVRLPLTAFAAGTSGGLKIAMTAQQLGAAAGASGHSS
jgi:preprotein translocase subunit YajC